MAVKKKPVKSVKKATPKKVAKPAAKKPVSAKKPASSKPVKKESPKKSAPVSKKPVAKAAPAKPVAKSPAVSAKKAGKVEAKKPVSHPVAKASSHSPAPVAKPVHNQPVVKAPVVKPEIKKPVFKQEVLDTSRVAVKPEAKKPAAVAKPAKVVIPEIKTKTVRKYEPEFTKSVLDTYQQEQTGPTMRYSDAELAEFRELITRKLEAAKKELAYLQGLITRRDEMGGDETDNRYMTMEDGSMSMEREQLSQMASRQITFIDHLEKAMMRIENKTYGICRVTGKLIDKARLKAVPHATLSIEAKQTMNK